MADGMTTLTSWSTIMEAGEEVMSAGKGGAGAGVGFVDSTEELPKTKQCREVLNRASCKMCAFGKMLEHEAKLLDPSSREATLFRKRCRVPYQVFKELVTVARKGMGRCAAVILQRQYAECVNQQQQQLLKYTISFWGGCCL